MPHQRPARNWRPNVGPYASRRGVRSQIEPRLWLIRGVVLSDLRRGVKSRSCQTFFDNCTGLMLDHHTKSHCRSRYCFSAVPDATRRRVDLTGFDPSPSLAALVTLLGFRFGFPECRRRLVVAATHRAIILLVCAAVLDAEDAHMRPQRSRSRSSPCSKPLARRSADASVSSLRLCVSSR